MKDDFGFGLFEEVVGRFAIAEVGRPAMHPPVKLKGTEETAVFRCKRKSGNVRAKAQEPVTCPSALETRVTSDKNPATGPEFWGHDQTFQGADPLSHMASSS